MEILIPSETTEVIPGVRWGRHDRFCTPAYWRLMTEYYSEDSGRPRFRLGRNLTEEVAACLLGGFGMSADVGLAAFYRIQQLGLLSRPTSEAEIYAALCDPLEIQNRRVRYRYPAQKAKYLSLALQKIYAEGCLATEGAIALRGWLVTFPGIGLKTASWIVRNYLASDEVAILDLHVVRACQIMGVFSMDCEVAKQYLTMEEDFLTFSRAIGASAALLDALIWEQMREVPLSVLAGRHAA